MMTRMLSRFCSWLIRLFRIDKLFFWLIRLFRIDKFFLWFCRIPFIKRILVFRRALLYPYAEEFDSWWVARPRLAKIWYWLLWNPQTILMVASFLYSLFWSLIAMWITQGYVHNTPPPPQGPFWLPLLLDWFYGPCTMGDTLPLSMELHPRVISSLSLDDLETRKKILKEAVPFYDDLHHIPSFGVDQTLNDLIGSIHIYQLSGVEKLERIYFYLLLDYTINFVCTNYIVDSGESLPPLEHRHLIFRTMLVYKNCDWQSTNVHKIHDALNLLNDEMTALIADYYNYNYLYLRLLTHKDYNMMLLKETALAQAAGLEPIDFNWGLFTPFGYEEKNYMNTWDKAREPYILAELQFEYVLMDYDLMRYYLEERMARNNREYDNFMRLKLGFEEIDMKMAGMDPHKMAYKDIVHYRTFAGESSILRYATLKAEFDVLYLQNLRKLLWKVLDSYNDSFLPPEKMSMLDEYRQNMEWDLERKRAAYNNKFFRKV